MPFVGTIPTVAAAALENVDRVIIGDNSNNGGDFGGVPWDQFKALFQSANATLANLAALVTAADKMMYFTGVSGAMALNDLTSTARTLLACANAAAMRTTLELGTIATQAASSVAITGGAITGTTVDGVSIKSYVDGLVQGVKWKNSVRVATTANGTLATAYENGDTVDGVVLATGDRILLKDQTTGSENGIYTINASGAPTRATDADTGSELVNAAVFVEQGTANADKAYVCTNNAITLGSTSITFVTLASTLGFGTAANQNIGTSGANVPLLNGNNVWSNLQAFEGGVTVTTGAGIALTVTSIGSGSRATRIKGGPSQSADIFDVVDELNSLFLAVNATGSLLVGVSAVGTNGVKVIAIANGTAPTTSPADAIQLWSEDITSGEACLNVKGENQYALRPQGIVRFKRYNGSEYGDIYIDGSLFRIEPDSGTTVYINTPNGLNVNASSGNVYLQGKLINNGGSTAGLKLYVGGVSRECFLAWADVNSLWRFTDDAGTGPGGFCSPARTPAQITADQNDYSPGVGFFQRWSSDASRNVTGMVAGKDGEIRWIWNVGAQNIVLINESASSAVANRWACSTAANITIPTLRKAVAQYDATSAKWRVSLSP